MGSRSGFRGIIQTSDQDAFRRAVGRLHAVPVRALVRVLEQQDALLRAALATPARSRAAAFAKMAVYKYSWHSSDERIVSPPSVKDVVDVANRVWVALEVLEPLLLRTSAEPAPATLGDAIDRLIARDCKKTAKLVEALLPWSAEYVCLLRGVDGRPAPAWPLASAWVYAWRVVNSSSKFTRRV
jgi:hypothetical protein